MLISDWAELKSLKNDNLGISGGHQVDISEFPWQVSIIHNEKFQGAGVLISSNWVITSLAQYPDKDLYVRAGSPSWMIGGQVVKVKRMVVHPGARPDSPEDNLALLELSSSVTASSAKPATLSSEVSENNVIEVIGWGKVNASASLYPNLLLEANIPVVEKNYCQKKFEDKFVLNEKMFCIEGKYNSKGACFGDEGGSVSVHKLGVVGIVNGRGLHCDTPSLPTIIVKVTKYRDWIKSITGI